MIAELASAATLGLLTAISPCPLATNIAAVSYVGRHAATPSRSVRSGIAYVLGRTLCYTALAGLLAAGLLAGASTSEAFSRVVGLLVGPVMLIAGALLLGLLPAPRFASGSGRLAERLGKRGDSWGALILGALFALSFCPSSAALFFGSLVPLAIRTQSTILVPVTYGVATGLPVLVLASLLALGWHGIGSAFDRIRSVERWLRLATGLVLIAIGLYLCAGPLLPA